MGIYTITGTTMKERAILEYNNIRYTCMEIVDEPCHFPIKDILVTTELSIQEVVNKLERPRRVKNLSCAILIEEENKELVMV